MKREKEEATVQETEELDCKKLSKILIKELNKDEDSRGKLAWCLVEDDDNPTDVKEWISTGSTLLDFVISNKKHGGVPVGKLTEFSGEEASGKSLICAHLAAECQKRGGVVVYIDTESAMNTEFMQQLGVDMSKLVYAQPFTVEEVGEIIERVVMMVRAKAKNKLVLIVWDSVANTPSKAELEGEFDINMNQQLEKSKLISKMMRKLIEVWAKERIAVVFTNQLKVKIGTQWGDPMTTPGGKAIPYLSSVRVRLTRSTEVKDLKTGDTVAINTHAKVVKNRLGPPLRKCDFQISFANGIKDLDSWRDYLHLAGDIEKADGWCFVTSFPSGKLEEKGSKAGQDRGIKFREGKWEELVSSNPALKKHVLDLLEKHLIVKYGEAPKDQSIDPESMMDAETLIDQVLATEVKK